MPGPPTSWRSRKCHRRRPGPRGRRPPVPRTTRPVAWRRSCSSFTASLRAPTVRPTYAESEVGAGDDSTFTAGADAAAGGVGAFLAAAAAWIRAADVESTIPVTGRPFQRWKFDTAVFVPGPKIPSAPPATGTPAASSCCWSVMTASPREPTCRPSITGLADGDGETRPSAVAVNSSTVPFVGSASRT